MRFIQRLLFSLTVVVTLLGSAGAQGAGYTVQFMAATTREEAEEKVRELKAKQVNAYIVKSIVAGKGAFFRVRAGNFPSQNEAKRYGVNLQQRGVVSEFFVTAYEKPVDDTVAAVAPKPQPVRPQAPAVKEAPNTAQPPSNNNAAASRSITNPPTGPATSPAPNPTAISTTSSANNPGLNASVGSAPAATAPPTGFSRYQDSKIGFSFDYPDYWTGEPLTDKQASEQRVNAGAMFVSQKDAAFIHAIWNEIEKANNPASENDLIVEVILKSMSSSDGIKSLQETARRVENQNGLIKTYLDLKALYQTQGQTAPLDFLGKAVIVRASRGILLVIAFYSKDAPPNAAGAADKIIASVRSPE